MKLLARAVFAIGIALTSLGATAQQQYFTYTGVTRVNTFRIRPNRSADFYKWMNSVAKILAAEKEAGLIQSFEILHSVDYVGPDKWDLKTIVRYKDMATLDTLAEKVDPIIAKVYGTPENRAAMVHLSQEASELVSSELMRTIELKP